MQSNLNDMMGTFRREYIDVCIKNIIFLKHITSSSDELFPVEVILSIIQNIWDKILEPLERYFCDPCYSNFASSKLVLGDIVDAISGWGKVQILQLSSIYNLFIEFNEPVKCDADYLYGIKVNHENGYISSSIFSVNIINGKLAVDKYSMYVTIDIDQISVIDCYLYKVMTEACPNLAKLYTSGFASNYRLTSFNKDVKRQITLFLLKEFGNLITKKGFWFSERYKHRYQSSTVNNILLTNKDINLIY